jgi:hypothetical protein
MNINDINRQDGYYWIKQYEKSEWEIAQWNSDKIDPDWSYWRLFCDMNNILRNKDLYKIDESGLIKAGASPG